MQNYYSELVPLVDIWVTMKLLSQFFKRYQEISQFLAVIFPKLLIFFAENSVKELVKVIGASRANGNEVTPPGTSRMSRSCSHAPMFFFYV